MTSCNASSHNLLFVFNNVLWDLSVLMNIARVHSFFHSFVKIHWMNKSQHIHSPLDIHFGHIYFVHTNTTTDTLVPLLLSACVRISLGLLSGEGDWAMQSLQPQFCWVCQRLYTPSSIMRAWLLHTQDSTLSISFLSSKECFKFVGFWKANTKIHTFVFFCLNLPFDFQKTVKYFKHTSRKIIKNNIESIQLSTT